MGVLTEAFLWLNDPLNWTGRQGVLALTRTHLAVSAAAVGLALVAALPVGLWLGHRGRGATLGVVVANTTRALPTLALLTLLAAAGWFGSTATALACAVFAVPPVLANAVTGVAGVDADARDAARGLGMSGARVLWTVEVPLALPLVAAGIRTGAVQVLATVPLAALVGGTSLGTVVVSGFATQRYGKALAGGILVAGLCLLVEGVLAVLERALTPPGLRAQRRGARDRRAARPGTAPAPVAVGAGGGSNDPRTSP
ncbi:binding-protein-dependent transport systems inner membrane component [Cellulomonas flavigena DSM 20109]|uniref:Binding-protein-dependent transport systems inner membrane component n=1 Tax=Cellulomonas flavigena (strain ATCC 482 / DSM 20109 / BCRC 11376 / JCM 18109 / NBRC 3775 / NCIMB 8073 / NRS 134) TaxID=446466 RepID=D5UCC3_CELFN|nr:ABC transporter permease subunit [Cellulomonas flavigena]ADG74237.1 binding-protein-dependent transport systems inner membrane component [Cellulomonas flavigena DSM 20109]